MDDKAKDFVECLLFDMLEWLIDFEGTNLDLPEKFEPKRCVPIDFHQKLLKDSADITDVLSAELEKLPVLLCWSADLFKRFVNSVCLKLIDSVDPEVDFLKVMLFLIVIITIALEQECYRWVDEIPKILETLLKERIQTKFYEENGFDAITVKCRQLNEDDNSIDTTFEEMKTFMVDSFQTELAATECPLHDELFEKRTRISIEDVKSHEETLRSKEGNCPFCDTKCISFLKALFEPRIVDKQDGKQSGNK